MGASQGKSKKEQKEEAREWARTKENEVAQLYAQNTELRNQILMMQEDMRALRDMLKGQQTALNESVKQMNERMTEMENDVKVVPFCHQGGDNFTPLTSISSESARKKEQEIYYRNVIHDENDHKAWEKEEKREKYTTSYMMYGRVYSLKQFDKIFLDELKFKKITFEQFSEGGVKPHNYHYPPRWERAPNNYMNPQLPYPPHKFMRLEPDTQPF
jgi:hypothetical protein